jgi:hypothetical protein
LQTEQGFVRIGFPAITGLSGPLSSIGRAADS